MFSAATLVRRRSVRGFRAPAVVAFMLLALARPFPEGRLEPLLHALVAGTRYVSAVVAPRYRDAASGTVDLGIRA